MLKKLLFTALISQSVLISSAFADNFYGIYQFSDKEFPDKRADQKIEFVLSKNAPKVIFNGVENAGEGCCAYYKAVANNLKTDNKGNISFEIGTRNLYMERSKIDKKDGDGMSSAVLKFKGKFQKNGLTIQCSSKDGYDCYITKPMVFKKIK